MMMALMKITKTTVMTKIKNGKRTFVQVSHDDDDNKNKNDDKDQEWMKNLCAGVT